MNLVKIKKYNEVYNKIDCDLGIFKEMSEYFTFKVPGYQFMPSYKNKQWDGNIRLLNSLSGLLYSGLIKHVEEFCEDRKYKIEIDSDLFADDFSLIEAQNFIKELNPTFLPREYQIEAFIHGIRNRKSLLLIPTASGKSFVIYLITRYINKKTLIIVPTISLVHQLASDFKDYGLTDEKQIHKITSGVNKNNNSNIFISTWQSIYKQPKDWFNQFDVIMGDECHLFTAKSLTDIMIKSTNVKYKIGFTGTLEDTQTHKLVLEGLFGPVRKIISTSELIEQKFLAKIDIKCIILQYNDLTKKALKKATYVDEMDFIARNTHRNNFIKNLALSLDGNTLLLFQYVEKHGKIIYDLLKDSGREVFLVYGGVNGEEREAIRKLVETNKNCIVVASVGVFSTGVNIKNLHNIIFGSPTKSKIRNLQSIGRVLRTSDSKQEATVFDIADDLSYGNHKNHTMKHFLERLKIYTEENFPYKIYKVKMK